MEDDYRLPSQPMHDLWIRLTVDSEMTVVEAEAAMPQGAYATCHEIAPNFAKLKGLKIGPGWNKNVRSRVGGVNGCTHIVEMLSQIATTAIQALWELLYGNGDLPPEERRTNQLNTCYAYRADGPLVRNVYPAQYTGDLAAALSAEPAD